MLVSTYKQPQTYPKKRRQSCNEHFFDEVDAERAYWLGFVLADGCVHIKKRKGRIPQFVFSVASKDLEHLQKLKTAMRASHGIYGPYRGTYIFSVHSYPLCRALERYGITPRKSLIVKMPQLPHDLMSHLCRGIIDGDGCIYTTYRHSRARKFNGLGRPSKLGRTYTGISVAGTRSVCLWFMNWAKCGTIQRKENIWMWGTVGAAAEKLVCWLYGRAGTSLDRKRRLARQLGIIN